MPVNHLVWFKFNAGVADLRIAEHLRALASLKEAVPGVIELSVGENFTDRADGHTHGLTVTLADKEALGAYAAHPEHLAVVEKLRPDAQWMAMDYEFEAE